MDVSLKFVGHTDSDRLFEVARIHRASPNMDVVLVYPTPDGREIPSLKTLFANERHGLADRLAENVYIVLVGPLTEPYLRSPALMEQVAFSSQPLSSPLEASKDFIWSCPHPGIKGLGSVNESAREIEELKEALRHFLHEKDIPLQAAQHLIKTLENEQTLERLRQREAS